MAPPAAITAALLAALAALACAAAQAATASGPAASAPEFGPRPPPRLPDVPSQFHAKARVWVAGQEEPMLVLYHFDGDSLSSREDYYHLIEGRHQRFYTSIKLDAKGINYMIFHKQEHSPRACFIVPSSGAAVQIDQLRRARYIGEASVTKNGTSHPCHHWRVHHHGYPTEFCVAPDGAPLVAESPVMRLDIIDFSPAPQLPSLFEPERVSEAKCGVFGSTTASPEEAAAHEAKPRPFV
jgi:hypothetical protein